jgi:hypothetical protein
MEAKQDLGSQYQEPGLIEGCLDPAVACQRVSSWPFMGFALRSNDSSGFGRVPGVYKAAPLLAICEAEARWF